MNVKPWAFVWLLLLFAFLFAFPAAAEPRDSPPGDPGSTRDDMAIFRHFWATASGLVVNGADGPVPVVRADLAVPEERGRPEVRVAITLEGSWAVTWSDLPGGAVTVCSEDLAPWVRSSLGAVRVKVVPGKDDLPFCTRLEFDSGRGKVLLDASFGALSFAVPPGVPLLAAFANTKAPIAGPLTVEIPRVEAADEEAVTCETAGGMTR